METIEPNTLYIVNMSPGRPWVHEKYAWTPDGVGVFWYDTEEEARADSTYPLDDVMYVTKDQLEEMRY